LPLTALFTLTNNDKAITTLTDALTIINGRCLVNIELKASTTDRAEMQIIVHALNKLLSQFVQSQQFTYAQFVISAFNHPLLVAIKEFIPQVNTAALIAHCPLLPSKVGKELQVQSVNPAINCLSQQLVNDLQQQGLTVWVYTVDRTQDIRRCIAWSVDAIFTNYPIRTRKIIERIYAKQN
jgi:glycerophosphoryl diester phosphodiesterase